MIRLLRRLLEWWHAPPSLGWVSDAWMVEHRGRIYDDDPRAKKRFER